MPGSREPDPEPVPKQIILSLCFSDFLIYITEDTLFLGHPMLFLSLAIQSLPDSLNLGAKCPGALLNIHSKGSMPGQDQLPVQLCLFLSCTSGLWALLVAHALTERGGILFRLQKD